MPSPKGEIKYVLTIESNQVRISAMDEHEELRQKVAYEVVTYFGTQTKVAAILGYPDVRNVTNWTTGKRWFPTKHCVKLEQASKGELSRQRLRPLDYADHWPELAKKRKAS